MEFAEARGCTFIDKITPSWSTRTYAGKAVLSDSMLEKFTFGAKILYSKLDKNRMATKGHKKTQEGKMAGSLAACAFLMMLLAACASRQTNSPERGAQTQAARNPGTAQTNAPAAASHRPARPGEEEILKEAEATPPAPFEGEGWKPLLDGKSLAGWRETEFGGRGEVECRSNIVVLHVGDPFTGISYTNTFPQMDYEIALDAMRVSGSDFFCGLTFPVSNSFCSLIAGGWGGSLLGLSSIDGMDASENETTKYMSFEQGKWYRFRIRVTKDRLEAWLDKEKLIDVVTKDRRVSLRAGEIEMSKPLGICSWETTGAIRDVKVRPVSGPADPPRRFR